MHESEGVSL